MATTVVLWDIDGTLLTTLKAGIKAWEDAAGAVLGVYMDLENMQTAGLTDPMIAREILALAGHSPDRETEAALAKRYVEALPDRLTQRAGFALPGVAEVLDALFGRDDILLGLLTGNYRNGANAKLERYRLSRFFEFGGFGDDGFNRTEIGETALARVRARISELDMRRVFLVGDSPNDVACGTALGIKVIAVASGVHTVEELHAGNPWWILEQMPSAASFCSRIFSPDPILYESKRLK